MELPFQTISPKIREVKLVQFLLVTPELNQLTLKTWRLVALSIGVCKAFSTLQFRRFKARELYSYENFLPLC
jgi:hypothetical protein